MPRFLLLTILGVLVFKIVTLAAVGPAVYQGRISMLMEGTWFERICAWFMQADPVSLAAAEYSAKLVLVLAILRNRRLIEPKRKQATFEPEQWAFAVKPARLDLSPSLYCKCHGKHLPTQLRSA